MLGLPKSLETFLENLPDSNRKVIDLLVSIDDKLQQLIDLQERRASDADADRS